LISPYLDFEWWKDARGYRLAEAEEPGPKKLAWRKKHPRSIELEPFRSYRVLGRVVRLGGKLTRYHPLDRSETDNLAVIFANKARSAEGVLDFIKTFGPLTDLGLKETLGEPVSAVIEQAKAMHALVTNPVKNKKCRATLIGRHSMEFSFTLDPLTETPRLRYQPKDLLGALWLQLGQHLMGGGTVKVCRKCGILFPAGPGTHRREDAEFCSDDHRTKYHNQNRGKEK
jgi:hypothetical protein